MFHVKYLILFVLFHCIIAIPQINLYYTDWVSKDDTSRHDCLRLVVSDGVKDDYEIMSYCLSESSYKFSEESKNFSQKFTFAELSKQNITSQQLYLWSTPIDIIERYQFYLNQIQTSNNLSLGSEVFYNCTIPKFGPMCQYEFYYYRHDHLTLFDFTRFFYRTYEYYPNSFTCYIHLQCDRGPSPACLDWTEICDGQIDCLNGGLDEEYCWQLEINECKDDEFRCTNGQCIPQPFTEDTSDILDCIDRSDQFRFLRLQKKECYKSLPPSLGCEDIKCERTVLTSSCIRRRESLLLEAIYSNKNVSVSSECWSAFKCLLQFPDYEYTSCDDICNEDTCRKVIEDKCPDVLFFPNTPILFDDIYFAYKKTDSEYWTSVSTTKFYVCYSKLDYDYLFSHFSMILLNNMKCIDFDSFSSQSTEWLVLERGSYPLYFHNAAKLYQLLRQYHIPFNYTAAICNRSNMYQCIHSSLTSSCVSRRESLLLEAMYLNKNHSVSDECWLAFKCLLQFPDYEYTSCDDICQDDTCRKIVLDKCPDVLFFPNTPILFDDIYFAYKKTDSQYWTSMSTKRFYICYTKSDYDSFFVHLSTMLLNSMKCIDFDSFSSQSIEWPVLVTEYYPFNFYNAAKLYRILQRYHLSFNYSATICNTSNTYRCIHSSKCVSIYRLLDKIYDCPYLDDENITLISETILLKELERTHFKCEIHTKYIYQSLVQNHECDCHIIEMGYCEDEQLEISYITRNIVFQHICDGFIELLPIEIGGRNETDETECEQWECNNIYTRCNQEWNCPNGVDETGCVSYSTLNCSLNYHYCISSYTKQFMCLPVEKAEDGKVDCLGATDEPTLCRPNVVSNYPRSSQQFYCINQSSPSCISDVGLCDGNNHCKYGDDEQFCDRNGISSMEYFQCPRFGFVSSDIEKFLCNSPITKRNWEAIHFTLGQKIHSVQHPDSTAVSNLPVMSNFDSYRPRCHRGLDLIVWSNTSTCLCPPSYYGDQCQYQNQRISLSIRFRALSDSWQTLFTIVISLVDDSHERIIHSYEQVTFLSARDCKIKFSMNLLYSTQPKDPNKQYAIHIDFYEKVFLRYRGSALYAIPFSFLPVHRLAFIVHIPRSVDTTQTCSDKKCIHGKCIRYANNPEIDHFCRCNEGWSGRYCTLRHSCTCSMDSLCIGVSANNRSICVCPMNKFGTRCLLSDSIRYIYNETTCQNGGEQIPADDYLVFNTKVVCICPRGFSGDLCELSDNKLILSFEEDITVSEEIFIHFFELGGSIPKRATTFRTMPVKQDLLTIYWAQPFHLVFTELFNKTYYLTFVLNDNTPPTTIAKRINSLDRCPHISELFNETFLQLHLLRRIKYYHLPCHIANSTLSCFYDDVHLCLCYNFDSRRLANCFNFNHSMVFNCFGQSECENGAQCLQDRPDCPTRSICICPPCFFGTRCQFSTSGFGLSLDAILGYHILPDVALIRQPFIIQMSLILTVIFVGIGLISSILSIITFKNKSVCEVGCGLYLLSSSITALLATIVFGLKFLILLLTQITIESNRSAVLFQCHSIDFLLRIFLCLDQWLNACVAVERAVTSVKGAQFNKKQSRKAAKFVIISLLIIIISSSIHDPIYRELIDEINIDDNIKRTWCIALYPPVYMFIIIYYTLFILVFHL